MPRIHRTLTSFSASQQATMAPRRPRGDGLLSGQPTPKPAEDLRNCGDDRLDETIGILGGILPCSSWIIRQLIWVIFWSFTAAPTRIWGSVEESFAKRELPVDADNSCQPVATVKAWCQKTFGLPTALAFYYFLYDYAAEPLLAALNCCGSELLTVTTGVGLLMTHFVTAVSMDKFRKRQERLRLDALAERESKAAMKVAAAPKERNDTHMRITGIASVAPSSYHKQVAVVEPRPVFSTSTNTMEMEAAKRKKTPWFKKLGKNKKNHPAPMAPTNRQQLVVDIV